MHSEWSQAKLLGHVEAIRSVAPAADANDAIIGLAFAIALDAGRDVLHFAPPDLSRGIKSGQKVVDAAVIATAGGVHANSRKGIIEDAA
jgi:hypothetical protein